MGTSAPTQGYDRFRRGRCPQRPGIPPPLCGPRQKVKQVQHLNYGTLRQVSASRGIFWDEN